MDKDEALKEGERVWLRHPIRNNNSLAMTIPAGIRTRLGWHMNAPLVITLEGDHMEVRQMDIIKASGVNVETHAMQKRRKSWKQAPAEYYPKSRGHKTEPPPREREES